MNLTTTGETDRLDSRHFDGEYYSVLLLEQKVSRQKWIVEEFVSGRISEKQFLEGFVIAPPNRLTPNDNDKDVT
jgi:hypothetical protein